MPESSTLRPGRPACDEQEAKRPHAPQSAGVGCGDLKGDPVQRFPQKSPYDGKLSSGRGNDLAKDPNIQRKGAS